MSRVVFVVVLAALLAGPASASHLTSPESVLFHKGKIYVSVIGDFGAEDGSIVAVDRKGNTVDTLVERGEAKDPKGMAIVGKKLWVADVSELRSYSLATGAAAKRIQLPEAEFANDLVADAKGNLWVSDTRGGALYRVTRRGAVKRFVLPAQFHSPNGLAIHPRSGELWFVTSAGPGESEIARRTKKGKVKLVKANKRFEGLDGLVFVGRSAVFTDFMTGALWRLSASGKLKKRATLPGAPADLTYVPALKRLLIPQLDGGHVISRKP